MDRFPSLWLWFSFRMEWNRWIKVIDQLVTCRSFMQSYFENVGYEPEPASHIPQTQQVRVIDPTLVKASRDFPHQFGPTMQWQPNFFSSCVTSVWYLLPRGRTDVLTYDPLKIPFMNLRTVFFFFSEWDIWKILGRPFKVDPQRDKPCQGRGLACFLFLCFFSSFIWYIVLALYSRKNFALIIL